MNPSRPGLSSGPCSFALLAPECGSWGRVARGTTQRTLLNPLGADHLFVDEANLAISRWDLCQKTIDMCNQNFNLKIYIYIYFNGFSFQVCADYYPAGSSVLRMAFGTTCWSKRYDHSTPQTQLAHEPYSVGFWVAMTCFDSRL